ncbi:MAG: DNA polymerase IV [Porticoccaceae bacterium]
MRKIIHCDADCFFAAVEMRDDPSLRHIPMAVGGSAERRGVIATCNYEARRFGVRSAMSSWQAMKLCPGLVLLPVSMDKYRIASNALRRIFLDYTDSVEMVSVDEAYLDVTTTDKQRGSATLIAQAIRERARREIGITVSAGVATNKFLAKVASEWRKPDGLFVIAPGSESTFVHGLPVRYIHGVGKVTASRLTQLGIATCGDLQRLSLAELIEHFGSFGVRLRDLCHGIDERPLRLERVRKSLSVEHTYESDLTSVDACIAEAPMLYQRLLTRLERLPRTYQVRKIQVKLKFSNFTQTTLEQPCENPCPQRVATMIADGMARQNLPVRLLGIGVQFKPLPCDLGEQLSLFPNGPKHPGPRSVPHPVGVQQEAAEVGKGQPERGRALVRGEQYPGHPEHHAQ